MQETPDADSREMETHLREEIVKKFARMTRSRAVGMREVVDILTGPDILPMLEELIKTKNVINQEAENNAQDVPSLRNQSVASSGGRDQGSQAEGDLPEPLTFDAPYLVN